MGGIWFEVWIRLLNLIKFRFMNLDIFRLCYLAVIFRILFTDGAAFLMLSNGLHYNNCTSERTGYAQKMIYLWCFLNVLYEMPYIPDGLLSTHE